VLGREFSASWRTGSSETSRSSRTLPLTETSATYSMPIKDFFPSINFGRVLGLFTKDRNFPLEPKVATVIAQIPCHNNQLPQGSPCSPVISNLIAHLLDIHLNKVARAGRCTHTRYVDDLTFSTNEKDFPTAVARLVSGSSDAWGATRRPRQTRLSFWL
jgi:RNA-directed DNA polymerase